MQIKQMLTGYISIELINPCYLCSMQNFNQQAKTSIVLI